MSLTFKESREGIPIGLEKHYHENNNQILHLNQQSNDPIDMDTIDDEILEMYFGRASLRSKKAKDEKRHQLYDELVELDKKDRRILEKVHAYDKATFFPLPPMLGEERMTWLVSGKAGSGKSYFSKELLNLYNKMGYKRLFFVSPRDDPFFLKDKGLKIAHIPPSMLVESSQNEAYQDNLKQYLKKKYLFEELKDELELDEMVDMKVDLELNKPKKPTTAEKSNYELTNDYFELISEPSVFLFDDFEGSSPEEYQKTLFLINQMLLLDRKNGVNVIVIAHKATGTDMRHILNECNRFIVFSRNLAQQTQYLFEKYLMLEGNTIKRIMNSLKGSRWCCVDILNKFAMSQKKCFLL